jgi:hypothetical protein
MRSFVVMALASMSLALAGCVADSEDRIVGYGPTTSQTTVKNNKVTTTHTGGGPIVSAKHTQLLTVKMFKEADPAGANALSARAHLGDKWEEIVKENSQKCG